MNHEGKYMTLAEKFVSAVTSIQDADLCFNEPVDDIMLNQIEAETGLTLPVEFKNLYKLHNGQGDIGDSLFDLFSLNSAKDILENWDAFKIVEPQCDQDGIKAEPEEGIKDKWCNSKWIPFASTADGHAICIDYDPAEGGNVGQIITFWYNEGERNLIADSFEEFIISYLKNLEEGIYIYDTERNAVVRKDGKLMFGT